jgi:hypothetical protein
VVTRLEFLAAACAAPAALAFSRTLWDSWALRAALASAAACAAAAAAVAAAAAF